MDLPILTTLSHSTLDHSTACMYLPVAWVDRVHDDDGDDDEDDSHEDDTVCDEYGDNCGDDD